MILCCVRNWLIQNIVDNSLLFLQFQQQQADIFIHCFQARYTWSMGGYCLTGCLVVSSCAITLTKNRLACFSLQKNLCCTRFEHHFANSWPLLYTLIGQMGQGCDNVPSFYRFVQCTYMYRLILINAVLQNRNLYPGTSYWHACVPHTHTCTRCIYLMSDLYDPCDRISLNGGVCPGRFHRVAMLLGSLNWMHGRVMTWVRWSGNNRSWSN